MEKNRRKSEKCLKFRKFMRFFLNSRSLEKFEIVWNAFEVPKCGLNTRHDNREVTLTHLTLAQILRSDK